MLPARRLAIQIPETKVHELSRFGCQLRKREAAGQIVVEGPGNVCLERVQADVDFIERGRGEKQRLPRGQKRAVGRQRDPDECVAVGAAIQGGVLGGDVKGLLLLDVTPLSLGIETISTAADNQTSVEVHVLQGEREIAAYNKTLGKFQLTGIAPAPRGVPQIEVTFDIDANGIVNVSAKDLGTGAEQKITITASSNLSKEDIDKAVKEAEQYAAEDKARKDEVDTRNAADQIIYQSEKTLNEMGDKVTESDKAPVLAAIEKLKEAQKGTDVAASTAWQRWSSSCAEKACSRKSKRSLV